MSRKIRVAICDRSPAVRYGLRSILGSCANIEIVSEVFVHREILTEIANRNADILIVDLNPDNPEELNCLGQFKDICPGTKIVVFTSSHDDDLIMKALQLGVQGFKLKLDTAEEIIKTIQAVSRGSTCLAPCVTNTMLNHLQKKKMCEMSSLSEREKDVLNLIAKGRSNNEIADNLFISVRTVKFHASAIFAKLNVKNRTEAALKVA